MATATRKKEQHISSCNIHLNGRVAPHVQANVIKEMFKYLVFQRNQIPMAFEQLKFEYQRQSTPANSTSETGKQRPQIPSMAFKRLGQLITVAEEHLSNIDTLFTLTFVPRVLVLFGATAVSPKEVHEIVFTNQESVHDSTLTDLRTKHCMRIIMQALITESPIWEAKQLSLTNTLLLVYAHRDSGLTWFKPKISFKVPSRCQLYRYEIHCASANQDDSCQSDCTVEGGEVEEQSLLSLHENEDYIWYQAPMSIKGLQSFTSKTTSESDIWA
ncbi:MAD2L1-binding protein-like [Asterias amurensis]|uniref:MAD2L1-binding protein-like n=1 Tax=Asterias amurensis TaxID=7602 RepID=UPI003AB869DB